MKYYNGPSVSQWIAAYIFEYGIGSREMNGLICSTVGHSTDPAYGHRNCVRCGVPEEIWKPSQDRRKMFLSTEEINMINSFFISAKEAEPKFILNPITGEHLQKEKQNV